LTAGGKDHEADQVAFGTGVNNSSSANEGIRISRARLWTAGRAPERMRRRRVITLTW